MDHSTTLDGGFLSTYLDAYHAPGFAYAHPRDRFIIDGGRTTRWSDRPPRVIRWLLAHGLMAAYLHLPTTLDLPTCGRRSVDGPPPEASGACKPVEAIRSDDTIATKTSQNIFSRNRSIRGAKSLSSERSSKWSSIRQPIPHAWRWQSLSPFLNPTMPMVCLYGEENDDEACLYEEENDDEACLYEEENKDEACLYEEENKDHARWEIGGRIVEVVQLQR